MDAHDMREMTEMFRRIAQAAQADPTLAQQARDALVESGLLGVVFGAGAAFDILDLLDTAGAEGLRAYLRPLSLAQLREIVRARGYDPDKTTARWRSANKFVDLIVTHAEAELAAELAQEQINAAAQQPAALAAASWML
jgi:hypothetical protein